MLSSIIKTRDARMPIIKLHRVTELQYFCLFLDGHYFGGLEDYS